MTPKEYAQQFEASPMGPYLGPEQIEFLAGIIVKAQAEAAAKEREACAKIVNEEYKMWEDGGFKVHECFRDAEQRIRARSNG